jgi:nucleoside-diphosphate-sugar epimerase
LTRVLVTGASGFVGSALCELLARSGYLIRATGRAVRPASAGAAEHVVVGDLGGDPQWQEALAGVDIVVHLAARAHILNDPPANASLYAKANALGTSNLAQQAAAAGVRQFVFLSSVKVNGEATTLRAFTPQDKPQPLDAYGVSKWQGEQFATAIGQQSGMRVAIIRSPLIYGSGVKANFLKLMRWVDAEKPLPLNAVQNRRSLVSVWNLCDLILRVVAGPTPCAGLWMVSDGRDLSTPELVRLLAASMGRRARLFSIPVGILRLLAAAAAQRAQVDRLCGSLVVDISSTHAELGWLPPLSVEEGLERTARWYLSEAQNT